MPTVELRCQNATALVAEYDYEIHAFLRILSVRDEHLVPFGARDGSGQVTRRQLQEWWTERAIPVTRDGYNALRHELGGTSPLDLLEKSYGLSLSDQFWLCPADDGLRWEDVNFFDNDFDGSLGFMTLGSISPVSATGERAQSASSPNSSLGGNLRKAWEIASDGTRILVKAGSRPLEQEPYNEVAATALYRRLLDPVDFVTYSLVERDGRYFSACPDMVSRDECLIPAWDLLGSTKVRGSESGWMRLLRRYEELGVPDAERQLTKMFVCDFILANSDRHWNNLAVIFDARDMRALRVASIYDTGASLWYDRAVLDQPIDFWYRPLPLIAERSRRIHPEEQLRLMRDFGWLDPTRLDGFAEEAREILAGNPNLDSERLDAVAHGIQRNIDTVVACARSVA